MVSKNPHSKYRLLVIMDESKASEIALKNAVQLAKTIKGHIEVFHIKAPTDVVKSDNQLSAMRVIHEDNRNTIAKLQQLVSKTSEHEGVSIGYHMAHGNVKSVLQNHIAKVQPNIIVLGKKKSKLINFLADDIIEFLLDECNANILIVGEDHKFHTYEDISLGVYGNKLADNGLEIINDLKKQTTKPIKFFSVRGSDENSENQKSSSEEAVSYVFSEGLNAFDGLASYVSKTNTQLFCIEKKQPRGTISPLGNTEDPLKHVLRKLDIPVLIMQ